MVRSLYDYPEIPVGSEGVCCRVIVATHPSRVKRRVPLGSHVRASSTNSSSPIYRSRHSPPPMSSSCICIAAPLSRRSRMKIRRLILIDGAATRPGGRKPGSVWLNGYGTHRAGAGPSTSS
jgi:hypothetical protein